MTQYKQLSYIAKAMTAGLLTTGVLFSATTQAAVSQAPLSLTEGVAPNLIVTIDGSTSMDSAFVPDRLGFTDERRFRANTFNAMAYNPQVTYRIPPSFKKDGTEQTLSTAFTAAPYNGFKSKDNEVKNLAIDYSVAQRVRIRDAATTVSRPSIRNPEYDFRCGIKATRLTEKGQTHTCTGDPQNGYSAWDADELDSRQTRTGEITITRGRSSCTAIMKADGVVINNVPCSLETVEETVKGAEIETDYYIADLTKRSVPAYYYVADKNFGASAKNNNDSLSADRSGGNADCKDGESCYRLVFVTATSGQLRADDVASGRDERQNFANWYSFYRARSLATISAASLAFYNLSTSTRMTWQSLSGCTNLNESSASGCGNNLFREYSKAHRGEFYHWMQNMRMSSGTPLRLAMDRAGMFLRNDAAAWQAYPNDSSKTNTTENTYACRSSYHVLMTDGMWNGSDANTTGKTYNDDEDITLPTGSGYTGTRPTKYTPSAPYQGDKSNTLADVAMNYWAMDLNSALPNTIKPYMPYRTNNDAKDYWDPRNNPADWQHMSNFIMGLGMTNSLTHPDLPWQGGTYLGDSYKKLYEGTVSWPTSGSAWKVYDLWHAAINSRGEFFSVESPDAMVQAFNNILTRIASRKSTAAAPATSNSLEADGDPEEPQDRLVTYSYQSSFDNTEDWVGDLKKVKTYRTWVSDGEGGGGFETSTEDIWSASSKLKNARTVYMAGSNGLQEFTTTNANSKLQSWLNINPETGVVDNRWDDRLNYIRGVRSNEGEGSTNFRKRSSLLGDLLASQPAVVQRPQYLELFSNRLEGNTQYTSFISTNKSRAGRIYIGGNDGMLHGFDTTDGKETFAFIPTAVFPNLNKLTGKNYTHHYYVDGSPEVADVYDSGAGVWKTILVGTLRAGGKGLFALDVTNPEEVKLLWEFDEFNYQSNAGHTSGMVGPGYSFPKPSIARLHNGKWAVVTGNGYEGANTNNGKAALYVIDAITGKLEKTLEVQSATTAPNGLSTPRLADFDSDGVADYAYAGDLHGNLWRFDLLGTGASPDRDLTTGPIYGDKNSTSTDGFKLAYGNSPMFTASSGTHSQPITAAPSLTRHPSGNGYLVIFGTGKYFEDADKTGTETHPQTLYAIWDQKTRAETTGAGMSIDRDALVGQTITATNLIAEGKNSGLERTARTLSSNTVSYYDTNGNVSKQGWYLDLAANSSYEGEMMIENMRVLGRDTLLISTLVPNVDPCAHGAGNWLYALNPVTGGRTTHHAFDTRIQNPNGSVTLVSAIKLGNEGGLSLGQDELGITAFGEKIDLGNSGRLRGNRAGSWRFIPNP